MQYKQNISKIDKKSVSSIVTNFMKTGGRNLFLGL